ncbi:MAG: helix-turn-helix domain-containing protein [Planctomycetes bacterium]|nr:helix-turn-helix domain-containing protein [Planctomycetota bacterium]
MADYQSFDDVLNELKVSEDQLNRLVSEGAIRAYRDEGKMKFRKDDVQALMASKMTSGSTPAMSPTETARPR